MWRVYEGLDIYPKGSFWDFCRLAYINMVARKACHIIKSYDTGHVCKDLMKIL